MTRDPPGETLVGRLDLLREQCPVSRWQDGRWAVLGYDEIVRVAQDPESFSSEENWDEVPPEQVAIPLKLDPPRHRTFRRILARLFTPAALHPFEARIRARAIEHLDPVIAAGGGDMVAAVTDPFPVKSLCDFLGWPAQDWREIKDRSLRQNRARHERDGATHRAVVGEWWAYIRRHLAQSRAHPGADIGSRFLAMIDAGEVTEIEVLSMMRLLLQAGHGTTTASAGIVIQHLATHPDDQATLRADPARLAAAIEEILRADNPLVSMPRTAVRDVELSGQMIRTGDPVELVFLAANRDPRIFEEAGTCRFNRPRGQHLIFGTGIHTCVGAPFARLELRILIEELLARTHAFRLAPGASAVTRMDFPRNEPRRLIVEIDPA
jgi:cytochrome P450